MASTLSVCLFILSFILILKGGKFLVNSSLNIAMKTKISPMILGATIVSLATTLPETFVSITATMQGDYTLAVGNAFGSMICNFALVLGLSFLFIPSKISKKIFCKKMIVLFAVIFVLFITIIDLSINILEAIILLFMFLIYLILNIIEIKNDNTNQQLHIELNQSGWTMAIEFIVGAVAIAYGANVLVDNINQIALLLGISEEMIATTIVAFGTSLPELVTVLTSAKKGSAGMGLGNMMGANIINATMIIGSCTLVSKSKVLLFDSTSLILSFPILLILTLFLTIPIMFGGKTYRIQGIFMIVLYLIYTIGLMLGL